MKFISKLCSIFIISFISFSSHAQPQNLAHSTTMLGVSIPSQTTLDSLKKKEMINNLFHWMNEVSNKKTPLNQKDLGVYFASNLTYTVNNKTLTRDLNSFMERFKNILAKNDEVRFIVPLEKIIIADSQAALTYQVQFKNKEQGEYTDCITTLITFQNGRIKSWNAVAAHE